MKKFLNNGLLLAAAGMLFFTACDPAADEEGSLINGPTITLTSELELSYAEGEEVELEYEWVAPGNLGQVKYEVFLDGDIVIDTTYTNFDLGFNNEDSVGNLSFTLTAPVGTAGSTVEIDVTIIDRENQSAVNSEASFEVTEGSTPLRSYTDILVYAPAADGTTNTWFSTNLGETVTEDEVNASAAPNSSDVDFGYYYGVTDEATIASPNAYNLDGIDISDWTTRNATEFRLTTISSEEYLNITTSEDLAAVWEREDNINEGQTISNLAVGDVVAFQLDTNNKDGLYGLFRVATIEAGDNSNDYIEIEVLVQE
ncbi:hypothetical protein [Marivirga sp.]|uniref:hypothetical protein n=1 Tax=Marivirga sp. TaxID=2018662 RepID=UPI002D7FFB1C|nr:hypothetical protein [Marivirga sp.]HET8858545.1 hypothetical protein [Marivirga sp.]